MNNKVYIFIGPPASGKATQSKMLSEELGCGVFSTGGQFRELLKEGGWLSERIQEDYHKGLLLPYWLATYLFKKYLLSASPEECVIFEGAGRNLKEAKVLHDMLEWLGKEYMVFHLNINEKTSINRSLHRHRDDGLDSDTVIVEPRFNEYKEQTIPAIEFFKSQGKLVEIDGEKNQENVHRSILKEIGRSKKA